MAIATVARHRFAGAIAGDGQRHQVGLGAAAGEHPVGVVAEPDPGGGPVDQLLLDQGRAGALVPGFHRRVERRGDRFGEDRRQRDGAIEMRDVARMMEMHGVIEIEPMDLFEAGIEIAERPVEIDRLERGLQLVGLDAAAGALRLGQRVADQIHAALHARSVGIETRFTEQCQGFRGAWWPGPMQRNGRDEFRVMSHDVSPDCLSCSAFPRLLEPNFGQRHPCARVACAVMAASGEMCFG